MPFFLGTLEMQWKAHAFSGALAVALGAFGAHALKAKIKDPKLLEVWETAVRYHFVHVLVGLAAVQQRKFMLLNPATKHKWDNDIAGQSRVLSSTFAFYGNVVFSGSLYALTLTDKKALGAITPIGGLAYIAAWICLAMGL